MTSYTNEPLINVSYDDSPFRWPLSYKYNIKQIIKNAIGEKTGIYKKRDIKQRLLYGISESDAWSLDTHLNKIIPRGIKYLRDSNSGVPGIIYDEHGQVIYDCVSDDDTSINKGSKIWVGVLDDIIAGFEANEEIDELYGINRQRRDRIIENRNYVFQKGMALMANNWNHLWW